MSPSNLINFEATAVRLLTIIAVLLGATSSVFANPPRIAIFEPKDVGDLKEAQTRLESELRAAGFDVVSTKVVEADTRRQVERAATEASAFAAIRLIRMKDERAIDVWIGDRLTNKTVARTIPFDPSEPNSAATVALRVVELLQASLVELELDDNDEPTPTEVKRLIRPEGPNLSLGLGPAVSWTPGTRPGFGPSVSVFYRATETTAAEVTWRGPQVGSALEGESASAKVRESWGLLGVRLSVPLQQWELGFAARFGFYTLAFEGSAPDATRIRSGRVFSPAGALAMVASRQVSSRIALESELGLTSALQPVYVRIEADRRGPLGSATLSGSLRLRFDLRVF